MAKALPFKTAPKVETKLVGDEETGILEFPIIGDITVREQAFINDKLSKHSTFLEIARISNKVAKAEKMQPIAAHGFLTKCATKSLTPQVEMEFSGKEDNMRVKYAREIEGLVAFLLTEQWERQLITVTSLVKHRLEGMEDFDVEDARDLGQTLVMKIYAFALIEMGAADDADLTGQTSDEEMVEQLGK